MTDSDLLLTIAEVAITLAGFAGLVTVLAQRSGPRERSESEIHLLYSMLLLSLLTAAFALAPHLPLRFGASELQGWRITSGAFFVGWLAYWSPPSDVSLRVVDPSGLLGGWRLPGFNQVVHLAIGFGPGRSDRRLGYACPRSLRRRALPEPVRIALAPMRGRIREEARHACHHEALRRIGGQTTVSIGDGGNPGLLLAMRRHANFIELVPLGRIGAGGSTLVILVASVWAIITFFEPPFFVPGDLASFESGGIEMLKRAVLAAGLVLFLGTAAHAAPVTYVFETPGVV